MKFNRISGNTELAIFISEDDLIVQTFAGRQYRANFKVNEVMPIFIAYLAGMPAPTTKIDCELLMHEVLTPGEYESSPLFMSRHISFMYEDEDWVLGEFLKSEIEEIVRYVT